MTTGKIAEGNTRFSLTLSKELKKLLEEAATKQNRSINNLIITVLKDYLGKNSK
jgi:predicted HicB family RNase H-like nuclease